MSARWRTWVPLSTGYLTLAVMVGGIGVWAVRTEIAGAVVAGGEVRVESERQVIQHPDGGVVGAILARDGDAVHSGDVLVQFDDTFLQSELEVVHRQLFEIFARKVRLQAEMTDDDRLDFTPPDWASVLPEAWTSGQVEGQRALFTARGVALAKEIDELREQQAQIGQQIAGAEAQLVSQRRQVELIGKELENRQTLLGQGLIQAGAVLELEREQARLEGEIGRFASSIAESKTRISSVEIEIVKLGDKRREEAISRLRDLQYSEIELEQRRLALAENLSRLEVRTPVDGVVFGSRIYAVKSVVQAAEPMMYVVPGNQPLQVSARVDPIDIDQVHAGQPVNLRFTTFDKRLTPEVSGVVTRVSADAVTDETSGARYYEAIIIPEAGAVEELGLALVPGMPVEAFMRTADRTPLSYLTQPLTNYFQRAFREG